MTQPPRPLGPHEPLATRAAINAPPVGRGLAVELTALESLNFALVHNSVPLVRALSFTNTGSRELRALEVTLELAHYAAPWHGNITSLEPGATHHFDELVLKYDEARLLNAAERDRATLTVRVEHALDSGQRTLVLEQSESVSILAYNEWRRDSEPQMLASFVLPNHPAVQRVLGQAREHLARTTGNPAMEGYQSKDPSRVRAIAQAVYESVAALGVTYANPPASFEETGQKIRTPEQVLGDRVATCMDVSALIAAALEQVGLHPLIVLTKGHAFPGVWLMEDYRADGGFWDAAALRNELALGTIELFDSSAAAQRPAVPFGLATAEAHRTLGDDDDFRFALDVRGARSQRYLPLPSRVYGAEFTPVQEVRVVQPAPSESRSSAAVRLSAAEAASIRAQDTPEIREAKTRLLLWRKQLLDLTLRNRLLNFNPDGRHGLQVLCPDIARLEDSVAAGQEFVFHGSSGVFTDGDTRSAHLRRMQTGEQADQAYLLDRFRDGILHSPQSAEVHQSTLIKLHRKCRESFEEAGAHTLFLGLGLLRWFESPSSERELFAPVLLIPVQLVRGSARDPWRVMASDESPLFNPSLIEKLQTDFGIDLSKFEDELPTDDEGIDVPRVFAEMRGAIRGMDRWELREEAHIGNFSFAKHAMWRDLGELVEQAESNALLRVLARKGQEPFPTGDGVPDELTLDQRFPPTRVFCPMDADSSQLSAILAAAGGESFVLQGPPGTGKSQTITNLITHCITLGKSVLFVSAKVAALDVVRRRLQRSHVGAFCLELHSHSANKKAVLEQLGDALRTTVAPPPEWQTQADSLGEDRERLNNYAKALHQVRPQGASLRDGMGALCRLRNAPSVRLDLGPPERLSRADLAKRQHTIAELVAQAKRIGPPLQHPLRALKRCNWSPQIQDDFGQWLDEAASAIAQLDEIVVQLQHPLGVALSAASLAELSILKEALAVVATGGGVCGPLLSAPEPEFAEQTAAAFIALGRERDARRQALDAVYVEAFHNLDLAAIAQRLRAWSSAFFLVAFFMLWGTRRLLRSVRRVGDLSPTPQLLGELDSAIELRSVEQRFDGSAPAAQALLGPQAQRGADWAELEQRVANTRHLRRSLNAVLASAALGGAKTREQLTRWKGHDQGGSPEPQRERALATIAPLDAALDRVNRALSNLSGLVACDPESAWGGQATTPADLRAVLDRWRAAKGGLRDWTLYQATRAALGNAPEVRLVEAFEREELSASDLQPAFERAYEQLWVSSEYEGDPDLTSFDSAIHEQVVERFRRDDKSFGRLAAQKAAATLAEQVPRGGEGEMAVLYRELKKQRRHLPIRKLFASIPTVRRRLKPCLLMSPLSVAQYLRPDERFDLVIFDEASQLPTPDAIGTVARGAQLIVVGDSKQLPPTDFFQRSVGSDDDIESDSADELESILDECMASQLQELQLRWHYRSQHEHLIAFSNHHYYSGQLSTFASADDRGGQLGIRLIPTKGAYAKGKARTNRGEAEALVAEVVRRLLDPEEQQRSLGIVTFSTAQQTLVEDLLEAQRARTPALERFFNESVAEPVFVKNLENVQGDERDVILFSICYGPDTTGHVAMNFGPLNRQGGERRLNVAVTRARQQLLVFSTLRADQIDLRRTNAVGVKHLKRFLEYAERGPAAISEAISVGGALTFDSPFEEEVYTELSRRGHTLATQVGCSGYRIDLAVVHPTERGRFVLGIECDGAAYHSARTARDRDRLRESVLCSLGWKLERVWSTDWWTQPAKVVDRLEAAIAAALEDDQAFSPPGANSPKVNTEPVAEAGAAWQTRSPLESVSELSPAPPPVNIGEPYRVCDVVFDPKLYGTDDLAAAAVAQVLPIEAPIHLRKLAYRIHFGNGMNVTVRDQRALKSLIETRGLGKVVDEFVWRSEDRVDTYDRVRVPDGYDGERSIEEIAIQELAAAAREHLHGSGAMTRKDLVRCIARTFGNARAGAKISQRVNLAIDNLVATGGASELGENISPLP